MILLLYYILSGQNKCEYFALKVGEFISEQMMFGNTWDASSVILCMYWKQRCNFNISRLTATIPYRTFILILRLFQRLSRAEGIHQCAISLSEMQFSSINICILFNILFPYICHKCIHKHIPMHSTSFVIILSIFYILGICFKIP